MTRRRAVTPSGPIEPATSGERRRSVGVTPSPPRTGRLPRVPEDRDKQPDPGSTGPTEPYQRPTAQQRMLSIDGSAKAIIPVIYGKVRTGGIIVYAKIINNYAYFCYWLGFGPIESVTNLHMGEKTFAEVGLFPQVNYNIYLGTSSQGIDTLIAPYDVNWTSAQRGIACLTMQMPVATLATFDPKSFRCDIEGLKVFDPRLDPTLTTRYYTENVALCVADFKISKRYGGSAVPAEVYNASLTAAANDCDAVPTGGTKASYRLGIKIASQRQYEQWESALALHAQLAINRNSGVYQFWVDKAETESGILLTDAGSAANIITAEIREKGQSERPTIIRGNFTNEDAEYRDDEVEEQHPDVATGIKEIFPVSHDFEGSPSFDQTKRLVIRLLNRANLILHEINLLVNEEAIKLLPGVVVRITSAQIGWTNKLARITSVTPTAPGTWQVLAEAYNALTYASTVQLNTPIVPTPGPSPQVAPTLAPSDLSATEIETVTSSGTRFDIRVSWTPAIVPFYRATRIFWRKGVAGEWKLLGDFGSGPISIPANLGPDTYEVKAQTVNVNGLTSTAFATASVEIRLNAIPNPVAVTGSIADGAYWTAPPTKTDERFGTAHWSHVGMASFDGTKINDGNLTAVAATSDYLVASEIIFDAGVGVTKTFRELDIRGSNVYFAPTIQYSDNGSSWTSVTKQTDYYVKTAPFQNPPTCPRYVIEFADAGAHRYWKIVNPAYSSAPTNIYEVQFREWGSTDTTITGYRIYSSAGVLLGWIDHTPSSGNPLALAAFLSAASSTYDALRITLHSVAIDGRESDGLPIYLFLSGTIANPIAAVATLNTTPIASLYWSAPPKKTEDQYPAACWSGVGSAPYSVTPSAINNGVTNVSAGYGTIDMGSAYLDIFFDAGVGVTKTFRECEVWGSFTGLTLYYSDDGSAWTAITATATYYAPQYLISSPVYTRMIKEFASVGAHRYWKVSLGCLGGNAIVNEIQWREWVAGSTYPAIGKYRVYSLTNELLAEVSAPGTSTLPVDISLAIARLSTYYFATVLLKTVLVTGRESSGIHVPAGSVNRTYATAVAELGATQSFANKTISAASNTLILASTDLSDSADLVRTVAGTENSVPTATATTLFSISGLLGRVEVFACIIGANPALYTASAVIHMDAVAGRITSDNGTSLALTLSGTDVQVTQTSGATQNVYWRRTLL